MFKSCKQLLEGKTHHHTEIDTAHLSLDSGQDINLTGVSAKAKRIDVEAKGDLTLTSVQDEHRQSNSSGGGGVQVEGGLGTAWGASAYGSASQGKSYVKQVTEQTGLFAEEGGYHINAKNVHLDGAAIASTNPANSELSTNKLTFADIENESSSRAMSIGKVELGVKENSASEGKTEGKNGGKKESAITPTGSVALPMYEQDKEKSKTLATLTEGKITLNRDSQPYTTTAAALGINTDLSESNKAVEAPKDINRLLEEQQSISASVGHIKGAVQTYAQNRQTEAQAEVQAAEKQLEIAKASQDKDAITKANADLTAATHKAEAWKVGGEYQRNVDIATNVITTALAGGTPAEMVASGASPLVNNQIKQKTQDGSLENVMAHAIWGGIEAAAGKGNVTAGAVAAASAEIAAPMIAEQLYGTRNVNELDDNQKRTIIDLSSTVAGAAAGVVDSKGNSANIAQSVGKGMEIGESAVEYNYLQAKQITTWLDAYRQAKTPEQKEKLIKGLDATDSEQLEKALGTRVTREELSKREQALIELSHSNECDSQCQTLAKHSISQLRWVQDNYDALLEKKAVDAIPLAVGGAAISGVKAIAGSALARNYLGSLPWKDKVIGAGLATGVSGAYQFSTQGQIKPSELLWDGTTAFLSTGTSFLKMNAINGSSAAAKAYFVDDKDPVFAGLTSVASSTLGWGIGKGTEKLLDSTVNYKYYKNPYEVIYPNPNMPSISKFVEKSNTPTIAGNMADNLGAKALGDSLEKNPDFNIKYRQIENGLIEKTYDYILYKQGNKNETK